MNFLKQALTYKYLAKLHTLATLLPMFFIGIFYPILYGLRVDLSFIRWTYLISGTIALCNFILSLAVCAETTAMSYEKWRSFTITMIICAICAITVLN